MFGAIVVLYNPAINEIEHIKRYKDKVNWLIVIDNSYMNNYERVNSVIKIDYLHRFYKYFPENIGLCKALNIGMKMLHSFGCKWALVFDADSVMKMDIIKIYFKAMKEFPNLKKVAIFAPQHKHDRNHVSRYKGYKKMRWAMTSGCLINVDIFIKENGFLEDLFVDGLDMDYCYKVREKDYVIIECGLAILEHYPAETRHVKFGRRILFSYGYASPYRYYMQIRGLVWVILRYRSLHNIVTFVYKWIKVVAFFDNKSVFFVQMLQGIKEGVDMYKSYKANQLIV